MIVYFVFVRVRPHDDSEMINLSFIPSESDRIYLQPSLLCPFTNNAMQQESALSCTVL